MKTKLLFLAFLLIGCSGGDGGDAAPTPTQPSNSSETCDGDVTFNTTVPAEVPSDSSGNDSAGTADNTGGIINPAVARALKMAKFQGLEVVDMKFQKDITIIGTCGSTINVGNSSNSNNTTNTTTEAPQ